MYRVPPPPLLAGYRIPLRGQGGGPLGALATRLGYPGTRGRGRGRGRGKGKPRNRGANRQAAPSQQKVFKEETAPTENVCETTANESKIEIIDESWQVISEETGSPKTETDNYVDFHNDTFDSTSGGGFITYSEPVLVISDKPDINGEEVAAEDVVTEEVPAEELDMMAGDVANEEVVADRSQDTSESQEITIIEDEPASEVSSAEQVKAVGAAKRSITAITAPEPSTKVVATKEKQTDPYVSLKCEVCNVYCYKRKHMKQHLDGRRHKTNVEAQSTSVATSERRDQQRKQKGKPDSGSRRVDGDFVSEAQKKYMAYTKSAVTCPGLSDAMQEFFRHPEPLIGLKYGVEVGKSMDDPNPVYYCSICDDYFNSSIKLKHFTSMEHRKIVLKAEFPQKCSGVVEDTWDNAATAYKAIAKEVESEVGRQVHLIRRKVVTTEPITKEGELLAGRNRKGERKVKSLLDLPTKDYLLEGPGVSHRGPPLLDAHDRVVRVVPPTSFKREREGGTWSPPPPAKRRSLLDPYEYYTSDNIDYHSFENRPELLLGPTPRLGAQDISQPLMRTPLLPPRDEPLDSRAFRQGLQAPKPLLSLDLPPMRSTAEFAAPSSFGVILRRMLDMMDTLPVEQLIRNEEEASIALQISNNLTKALLTFRMHTTPNVERTELGSVYSMFAGVRR